MVIFRFRWYFGHFFDFESVLVILLGFGDILVIFLVSCGISVIFLCFRGISVTLVIFYVSVSFYVLGVY